MNTTISSAANDSTCIIDDYVIKRIEYRVSRLAIALHLSDDQKLDYKQAMITEILSAFGKFDPARAQKNTFIAGVLNHFVNQAFRNELTRRQRPREVAVSICDIHDDFLPAVNDPCKGELGELEKWELKEDTETILSRMPKAMKRIAVALMQYNPSHAAEHLGISRQCIYRNIPKIRKYFEESGYEFI